MTHSIHDRMPDTTTGRTGRHPVRRFLLSSALFTLALFASGVMAQDPGEEVNCSDFATQQEAQQFFEQNDPAQDPFNLDANSDGVACETLNGNGDPGILGAAEAQYQEPDAATRDATLAPDGSPVERTPETGGVAMLPLAGALVALGAAGFSLNRR